VITFHRVLIGTAILFCLGFAAWAGVAYRANGGAVPLAMAIGFGAGGLALAYYLRHLNRFLGRGK
jgi:hypothetical protein